MHFLRAGAGSASRLGARFASSATGDAFAVLGLRPTATTDEVKKAYRTLAKRHHPDVTRAADDGEAFKRITSAYTLALLESARERTGEGFADGSGAGAGTRYGPGRRRGEGREEYSRASARPRSASDNFNHSEWDSAHYGAEREEAPANGHPNG